MIVEEEKKLDTKDILWYLQSCGGMDFYKFDNYQEANNFGHAIRDQEPNIDVEINLHTVRLYIPKKTTKPKQEEIDWNNDEF